MRKTWKLRLVFQWEKSSFDRAAGSIVRGILWEKGEWVRTDRDYRRDILGSLEISRKKLWRYDSL